MRKVVLVSALVVLLACGSSDGSSNPGGGSSGPLCTLTISGGMTGSFACTLRSATLSYSTGTGTVMLAYDGAGQPSPLIGATFNFPEAPSTGTFTETDADAGTTAQIRVTSGGASWSAIAAASGPPTGAFTLDLTQVSLTATLDNGAIFAFSGTLDATLPPVPQTSATSNVTLHAAF